MVRMGGFVKKHDPGAPGLNADFRGGGFTLILG
ncbi:unnamed protein product, partial [marine sediment metagenome]